MTSTNYHLSPSPLVSGAPDRLRVKMDAELSYYGRLAKVMAQYEPKGLITQGEMALEIAEITSNFLRDVALPIAPLDLPQHTHRWGIAHLHLDSVIRYCACGQSLVG